MCAQDARDNSVDKVFRVFPYSKDRPNWRMSKAVFDGMDPPTKAQAARLVWPPPPQHAVDVSKSDVMKIAPPDDDEFRTWGSAGI